VVENIPDEFNTIDKVNEFFKSFGSLTNIQVDQPAHKALIQYSTRDEASAAYNSPEVIFGNRFVKVYWQPDDLDSATFGRQPKPTGQVRPETPASGASHYPMPPATSVLMTPERAAELAEERAAAAAKKEENKKTMQEIQRQKEALIQRQQEEQKLLMQALFAKKNMSQKDKDEILSGLKNVAIEVTKESVDPHAQARAAATAAEAQRQADLQKEAERLEKARLDTELEVLNTTPSVSGTTDAAETTAALKAKLAALQAQVCGQCDNVTWFSLLIGSLRFLCHVLILTSCFYLPFRLLLLDWNNRAAMQDVAVEDSFLVEEAVEHLSTHGLEVAVVEEPLSHTTAPSGSITARQNYQSRMSTISPRRAFGSTLR
jgi:hypothetical protein